MLNKSIITLWNTIAIVEIRYLGVSYNMSIGDLK